MSTDDITMRTDDSSITPPAPAPTNPDQLAALTTALGVAGDELRRAQTIAAQQGIALAVVDRKIAELTRERDRALADLFKCELERDHWSLLALEFGREAGVNGPIALGADARVRRALRAAKIGEGKS